MTLLQVAAEQLHYSELCGENLSLQMFFQFPLEQVTELVVLREGLLNVQIDNFRTVARMFSFFEFSGSYQNVVTLFMFLYYLLFFRPKSPEKVDNECCLMKTQENSST